MEKLTPGVNSSQAGTPAKSAFSPQFRIERIREEILTYLAGCPRKLREIGSDSAGEVALSIGNCLSWIAGHMEARSNQRYQGPEQTPVSIYALGSQFQEIGRELMDKPRSQGHFHDRLDRLEEIVRRNSAILARSTMPTGHPNRDEVFNREEVA